MKANSKTIKKRIIIMLILIIISLASYSVYLHSFSKARKAAEAQINIILSQKDYKQMKEMSEDDYTYDFFTMLMELNIKETECLSYSS